MTLYVHNESPNGFVRFCRRLYNPLGFKKGYNFVLFFIAGGYLFGFGLARLEYLDIDGIFKHGAQPGEWYYYGRENYYYVNIVLHLAVVVPAAILAPWQFLPVIRYKALLLHRINGWLNSILITIGAVTGMLIAKRSAGGSLSTQTFIGALGILEVGGIIMAIYNIKRLQIDQHRAWMMRAWVWAASIITLRLIQITAATIITDMGGFWFDWPCQKIAYTGGPKAMNSYAACRQDPNTWTAIEASMNGQVQQIGAALNTTFGPAGWLALLLHAIGIELYLALTPAETRRLKQVSYERQLAKGMKHPGDAGLTVERFGDAEAFIPTEKRPPIQGQQPSGMDSDGSADSGAALLTAKARQPPR